MTLYDLKPRFQSLLRPLANALARGGVTANHVTLAAIFLSLATGALLALSGDPKLFWLMPLILLLRVGLNAIDGMIAREHGQVSKLGMFLNEIGDVVSDSALILPFAFFGFGFWGVVGFAFAAALSEFAGVLAIAAGSQRRYDGPMGKSDRALALAAIAVLVATGVQLPGALSGVIFPALAAGALITMANRVRKALQY